MNTSPFGSFLSGIIIKSVVLLFLIAVSAKGLLMPELEGLDGAHHVMDGVFFHDFFRELPQSLSPKFAFNYYKQYPALGFIFWPPLFPAFEGVVFLFTGISLLSAQFSILLCATLLAFCMYRSCRYYLPVWPSFAATLILLCLPGLHQYFNVVMLEIPTLAMMASTALLYLGIVNDRNQPQSHARWMLLAFVAALSLYTKQTAFILFPALAVDLCVNHRGLLRHRPLWVALCGLVLFSLPLALFTLKFGKANLAQSIGQNTQLIMAGYQGMARWSIANWLYYAKVLPDTVSYPVLLLALAEIVSSIVSPSRLKQNCLWIVWLIAFYVFFSYFDNKTERFSTLATIPLVVLSALCVWRLLQFKQVENPLLVSGAWGVLIACLAWTIYPVKITTISGTHQVMDTIDFDKLDGNIAYLGKYRPFFVYDFRLKDPQRKHFVLKGDDVLSDVKTLATQLRDYQVRYILVEPDTLIDQQAQAFKMLKNMTGVVTVSTTSFKDDSLNSHNLLVLKNTGVFAEKMRDISLSSKLIQ